MFRRLGRGGDRKPGVVYKNDPGLSRDNSYLRPVDIGVLSTSAVSNRSYMDAGQLASGRQEYSLDTHAGQSQPSNYLKSGGQGDPRAPSAHGVPSDHSDVSIQAQAGSRPTVWTSAGDITKKTPEGNSKYDSNIEKKY